MIDLYRLYIYAGVCKCGKCENKTIFDNLNSLTLKISEKFWKFWKTLEKIWACLLQHKNENGTRDTIKLFNCHKKISRISLFIFPEKNLECPLLNYKTA